MNYFISVFIALFMFWGAVMGLNHQLTGYEKVVNAAHFRVDDCVKKQVVLINDLVDVADNYIAETDPAFKEIHKLNDSLKEEYSPREIDRLNGQLEDCFARLFEDASKHGGLVYDGEYKRLRKELLLNFAAYDRLKKDYNSAAEKYNDKRTSVPYVLFSYFMTSGNKELFDYKDLKLSK